MTSPESPSVLTSALSPSPLISPEHSPVRRRRSGSESSDYPVRPRLSPTLTRAFHPDDPDVRERQRAMDADMAMQLSRARSNSVLISPTSPTARRSSDDRAFPELSLQEQQDLDEAREGGHDAPDADLPPEHFHPGATPDTHAHVAHTNHLSAGHDPSLLVSIASADGEDPTMGALPMYQATVSSPQSYDFSHLEHFARDEKARLGIRTPSPTPGMPFDFRTGPAQPPADGDPGASASTTPATATEFALPRTRQRKLSQSNGPRRGKMALFEQTSAPPPSLGARAPFAGIGTILSAVPSYDHLPSTAASGGMASPSILGVPPPGTPGGHDRPYRFSFYANALSATIHARSLSELPAEGQSFEDLFLGKSAAPSGLATPNGVRVGRPGGTSNGVARPSSVSPQPGSLGGKAASERPSLVLDGSPESYTWWLDVLSPTDEEMKLLSRVFNIHPLTTEDIQMEETREKIELFRNYYLVCFRGFDQDPYSPTHLEPINMYLIVFREGIISFHFRPTPHPQNVRRRIKQLKDYISVTSDWISYALIDDITDAFGPLIQSIEYEVDSIDELVLILKDTEQSDMLRRIGTCRKKVMGLLRLMGNKADVVKGLAKRCNENWRVAPTSDIGLYLSDIQDHLITMTQNLNHYEKILSRSHSNYLAQISIEMTEANNQINDVLSKLTALGTVLIPMNLITGIWGMNVHVPGQDDQVTYHWFGGIIAVLCVFAIVAGWSTYRLMVRKL